MKAERRVYRARQVTRTDSGGTLYAPVDQHGREHGMTPSYDGDAITRACQQLNGRQNKCQSKPNR